MIATASVAPRTVTVAEALALPPGPVQVSVYVVVTAGETAPLPATPPDGPALSTPQLVALLALQESVLVWPLVIDVGLAAKDAIVGAGGGVTVTVVVAVAVPPALVHVRV